MYIDIDLPIETEFVEFKSSLSQLDRGIETMAAMLNKHERADIFFGVADDGKILGVQGEVGKETIKKIETRVSESIKPAIIPSIVVEDYGGAKVIHVSAKGNRKPYSCSGDYRIRVGSSNKKIDPELLGEIFFDSALTSLEATESINQDLTFNRLKYYFTIAGLTINDKNFAQNAGLIVNGKYNLLAELLADSNGVSIKVVRFAGSDKLHMVSRNEYGYKCLISSMKEANEYVLSLNETKVDIESALERKETKLFDSHAFEEAWTNACIHNKWIRNVPPAIYIFNNRIEIVSTGGLPYNFSKEDFYGGVSRPVNPGLFKIMGQLGLIEQTGHGNLVILEKYGKKAFDLEESHITVTIPFAFEPSMKQIDVNGLSPTHAKVLKAIKENPLFTIKQLATYCELGTTRIVEIIADLKKRGKIERKGARKGGYWEVQ
ncbi:MAG: putative DNA binding domain-containing protein [Bacillales bacterium]|nr:putative DNA binding domain-containing protein [Bacillales bacterium]MDY5919913.1 putative DNA binding domain-containing protein [Candidatus Enteromonas sp.]